MQPGFRQNVDPTLRRKTNKSLTELTNLKNYYEQCKQSLAEAEASLNKEKDNLDQAGVQLEEARNRLSEAQTEVDADYLPEGAQPRARIQHRDDLVLVRKHKIQTFYLLFSLFIGSETTGSRLSSAETSDSCIIREFYIS